MDSAGSVLMMRTAPALKPISVRRVDRVGTNRSVCNGGFPFKRGGLYAPTPVGVGCSGTRRICVQAVDISSRPKGAASGKQPFVEPQWLLSSTVDNYSDENRPQGPSDGNNQDAQESTSSETKDRKQSVALYCIVIYTSKDDKSSLSEPNAGILLSMIGEDGSALMHRIPGTDELGAGDADLGAKRTLRFQTGGVDVVTVVGPDLGRLAALWIAPEAGTWRPEMATLVIIPWSEKFNRDIKLPGKGRVSLLNPGELEEMASMGNGKGVFHLFKSNEVLLGSDAWQGAVQLTSPFIQETSDVVDLQNRLLQLSPEQPRSSQGVAKLREDSMKEYESLKLSLLGFSALLVATGTVSLAALGRGDLAEGFAAGGIGGFLYLLLLQRTVDQLPGNTSSDQSPAQMEVPTLGLTDDRKQIQPVESEANSEEKGRSGKVESSSPRGTLLGTADIGLRGRIVLVAGVALVLGRLAGGGAVSTISPPQLLAGVVGFLTSRVAVVLAALKPTSSPEDK